jgi:hypothetical protein
MVQGWQRRKDGDGARMATVQGWLSTATMDNGRSTMAINNGHQQRQSKVAVRTAREFLFNAKTSVSKDLIHLLLVLI